MMKSARLYQRGCPIRQSHVWAPRAQGCSRLKVSCAAQLDKYKPPSSAVGATELDYLESYTTVVPDTLLLQNIEQIEAPKAATVSSAVLAGILRTPGGLQEYKVSTFAELPGMFVNDAQILDSVEVVRIDLKL